MREHAATDWSWCGGPVRPGLLIARLRSDQGLGGLSGQVTDHASVDDV
jgi:hypothetical protein